MQHLSFYLKKFENLGLKEKNIKLLVIETVKEFAGVELEESDLEFVRDQIRIKKTGPAKTEIFLNRSKIEEKINEKLNQDGGNKEVLNNKRVF
jgi:hypothetical protein